VFGLLYVTIQDDSALDAFALAQRVVPLVTEVIVFVCGEYMESLVNICGFCICGMGEDPRFVPVGLNILDPT
jgi:hypothetical protein